MDTQINPPIDGRVLFFLLPGIFQECSWDDFQAGKFEFAPKSQANFGQMYQLTVPNSQLDTLPDLADYQYYWHKNPSLVAASKVLGRVRKDTNQIEILTPV